MELAISKKMTEGGNLKDIGYCVVFLTAGRRGRRPLQNTIHQTKNGQKLNLSVLFMLLDYLIGDIRNVYV